MTSSKSFGRAIATVVLCAFLPVSLSACFGRFELVRKTYNFNKDISSDKWIQWLFFLLLVIVPIYGIASLVDAVVINSIEFWTGKNPVLAGTEHTLRGEDGEVAVMRYGTDGTTVDVEITASDGTVTSLRLVRASDSILAWDGDGNLVGRVGDLGGEPALLAN